MATAHGYTSLLIITLLAFFVPLLVNRIRTVRIPVVVAEIAVGIVIGRSGFGIVGTEPWLEFLSTLGFAYLMFLSGLEIDFSQLLGVQPVFVEPGNAAGPSAGSGGNGPGARGGRRSNLLAPAALGVGTFLLTVSLALLASLQLFQFGLVRNPYLMALILSTTSLGIVVPILKERGLTRTAMGQTILISAVVADFATMLLITGMVVVIEGQGAGAWSLLLILVLFVAVFLFYRLGIVFFRSPMVQGLIQATAQMGVRAAFALILIFIALSEVVGAEAILGAFLAGAIISLLAGSHGSTLHDKLDAIGYGFLVPIFFITVGMRFNAGAVFSSPGALLLVPVLLVLAYAVKLVPALLLRLRFSWRETLAAGFLLSSRLSLIIAAAAIGLRLGVISEGVNAALVLVAIVTCTISPILFSRFLPPRPGTAPRAYLVVGGGNTGQLLARRLKARGQSVHLIDTPGWCAKGQAQGLAVHPVTEWDLGAAAEVERAIDELGAESVAAVVALTLAGDVNLALGQLARARGVERVVVLGEGPTDLLQRARAEGVQVLSPSLTQVLMLHTLLEHPATWRVLLGEEEDVVIVDLELHSAVLAGRPLRSVQLPGNCLLLSVGRGEQRIVPHGDTRLQLGDQLTVIGSPDYLDECRRLMGNVASM